MDNRERKAIEELVENIDDALTIEAGGPKGYVAGEWTTYDEFVTDLREVLRKNREIIGQPQGQHA